MKFWQKALGVIRKILNGLNAAGYIPSQGNTIPTDHRGKPHDPSSPDLKGYK